MSGSLRTATLAATAAVFLVGVGRMGVLVLHAPLLGYANNYDFIKLSSTVGIWVDEPGADPLAGHPSAPYRKYRIHGKRDSGRRYLSSELLLVLPAVALGDVVGRLGSMPEHAFDLRVLGAWKWIVFSAAGAFLTVLFSRRSPWMGLVSALIFAAVVADPIDTLYFNTLYFDDSAVLFAWLAIGFALLLLHGDHRPRWLLPAFCASLFFAALSKMQHPGVALAIALGFAIGLSRRDRRVRARMLFAPFLAAVVALAAGFINNQSRSLQSMAQAAATDTWFWTVLPVLRDPAAVLREHDIPTRCIAYVGKSWYHPGMQPPPCPQIFRLSRFSAVLALLREPSALLHLLGRGIALSRPFLLPYGHVEGRDGGRVAQEGSRFASLGGVLDKMGEGGFIALWALVLAGGLTGVALCAAGHATPLASLAVLTNAVCAGTFCASLLGDGLVDFARHVHLGQNAWIVAGGVSAAMLVDVAGRSLRPANGARMTFRAPGRSTTDERGRSDGAA